jgi:hypothetical protein
MFALFYYYEKWQKYKRCKIFLGTPLFLDCVKGDKKYFIYLPRGSAGPGGMSCLLRRVQRLLRDNQGRAKHVPGNPMILLVSDWPKDVQYIYHVTLACPEMEVTEIILAKIYRLCQLLSHSHGFF